MGYFKGAFERFLSKSSKSQKPQPGLNGRVPNKSSGLGFRVYKGSVRV